MRCSGVGLFKKAVEKTLKGDEFWLLDNGTEGTAVILASKATRRTTSDTEDGQRVYELRLRVTLPGAEPYEVDHEQWTFDHAPPSNDQIVRVKVDPDDREHLTIDWRNPLRGLHESGPSVAEIVEQGTATRAVIRRLGDAKSVPEVDGKPVVVFVLDVVLADGDTFEASFAQPVPPDVKPSLDVGVALPVRYVTPDAEGIAIDWASYRPS